MLTEMTAKRRLHIDALIAEAHATLQDALRSIERFDELKRELWALGYYQVPEVGGIVTMRVDQDGGFLEINNADFLLEMGDPAPIHPGMTHMIEDEPDQPPTHRRQSHKEKRFELGRKQKWTCLYCAESGTETAGPDGRQWHVDHSYPFVQDGDNKDDNLVLACATCNLEKHAMSTLEFLRTKRTISITAISDDRKADEPEACGRRTPSREVAGVTEA